MMYYKGHYYKPIPEDPYKLNWVRVLAAIVIGIGFVAFIVMLIINLFFVAPGPGPTPLPDASIPAAPVYEPRPWQWPWEQSLLRIIAYLLAILLFLLIPLLLLRDRNEDGEED